MEFGLLEKCGGQLDYGKMRILPIICVAIGSMAAREIIQKIRYKQWKKKCNQALIKFKEVVRGIKIIEVEVYDENGKKI